jgi:hypothetical protein
MLAQIIVSAEILPASRIRAFMRYNNAQRKEKKKKSQRQQK